MPAVLLELFPPAIAAILITGAIAAMISTADSLLILSATEMSENLIKPSFEGDVNRGRKKSLRRSRIVTASLAVIALALAYVSPSRLIFTLVSYVWAGIGCTFSVVILFSLFWKRYHGRAVLATIITGLLFTIFWMGAGFEQHYRVTDEKLTSLVNEQVITDEQAAGFAEMIEKKFVSVSAFERTLRKYFSTTATKEKIEETLPKLVSSFIQKGLTARLFTFIVALVTAVLTTYLIPKKKG
jgi:Na+/proline symporter